MFLRLQLAAERCCKSFSEAGGDREKELRLMLDWASEGFLPTGAGGFAPAGGCGYPSPETVQPALRQIIQASNRGFFGCFFPS